MSNEKQDRSFTGWVERPVWQRAFIVVVLFVAAIVLLYLLTTDR